MASAGDYSLSDFISVWIGLSRIWYLSFQMVYRSAMGFPALCPWACLSRVRSYLSHLSYSGCWCWRLLSSFPGHGAEPAWWQHRLITVRRFTERDVHHSRLHCFYYEQTNPEHRQTGERVWWSLRPPREGVLTCKWVRQTKSKISVGKGKQLNHVTVFINYVSERKGPILREVCCVAFPRETMNKRLFTPYDALTTNQRNSCNQV